MKIPINSLSLSPSSLTHLRIQNQSIFAGPIPNSKGASTNINRAYQEHQATWTALKYPHIFQVNASSRLGQRLILMWPS